MTDRRQKLAALDWLVAMGADEAIGDAPVDRRALRQAEPLAPETAPLGVGSELHTVDAVRDHPRVSGIEAEGADPVDELRRAAG